MGQKISIAVRKGLITTMATTLEKARKFMRQDLNRTITAELGFDLTEAATFADSLSTELREENARLREALEKMMGFVPIGSQQYKNASAALSKESQ